MRVNARRYAYCIECSQEDVGALDGERTVQWIVEAPVPKRGAWDSGKPAKYKCQECGTENY